MASAAAAEEEATLEALAYTLIRITSLLLLGYVSARHLLPPGAQSGISAFVGTLALPALLFSSIAILQWDAVDWTIVAAVMLAKALTLACCVGVGVLITPRPANAGAEILNGAVLALLAVSSDDLGLGLPVMSALYGRGSRYVSQLFVIVPLHNLLVNPALLSLLALGCAQRRSSAGGGRAELGPILRGVLRGLAGNPLVLAVIAGLATNLAGVARRGHAPTALPRALAEVSSALGDAYPATVLVLAGMASVGSSEPLLSARSLATPALAVLLKCAVFPLATRTLALALGPLVSGAATPTETLDFAFLYGTLATSNVALVIASCYELAPKTVGLVAATLSLSKLVGFPPALASAACLRPALPSHL